MKPALPLHVVARPRADGTFNVLFRVRRDRPADFPTSVPLPVTGRRTGQLDDDEVRRIHEDAERLSARLEVMRAKPNGRTLDATALDWELTWPERVRARTVDYYKKHLRPILSWAGDRDPATIKLPAIVQFLAEYDDRPGRRAAIRRTLSALLSHARATGRIETHPLGVPVRLEQRSSPKRPVTLWQAADVADYAQAATTRGWEGIANLLWLMWETSADASDCIGWRRGVHFHDGASPMITYARGKTGARASVPISETLATRLRECPDVWLVYDQSGEPYGVDSVRDDGRRSNAFRTLRRIVAANGGRELVLDHLRHSAVTDALTKGAALEHLPSLTAHRGTGMVTGIYAQISEQQARLVQRARGIVQ